MPGRAVNVRGQGRSVREESQSGRIGIAPSDHDGDQQCQGRLLQPDLRARKRGRAADGRQAGGGNAERRRAKSAARHSDEIQALANYNIDLEQLAFDDGRILERNHIDLRIR